MLSKSRLQLLPATEPSKLVATDIFRSLPKTTKGKQHVMEITDRYSKRTQVVPTARNTTTTVACKIFHSSVILYIIPSYFVTDNGAQFVGKFFGSLCTHLDTNNMTKTAYHPKTSEQIEGFNKTVVARLRHYFAIRKGDWDHFMQFLTYAYNMQVDRSTITTSSSLILTRHPQGIATFDNPSPLASDAYYATGPQALQMQL